MPDSTPTITPFLWFDGNVEEAIAFYTSVFKDSKITEVSRMGGPDAPVMSATFLIEVASGVQIARITFWVSIARPLTGFILPPFCILMRWLVQTGDKPTSLPITVELWSSLCRK